MLRLHHTPVQQHPHLHLTPVQRHPCLDPDLSVADAAEQAADLSHG